MIYVFDTSSLRSLQHFYPRVFKRIWDALDELAQQCRLISTREVFKELEQQAVTKDLLTWAIPCIDLEEFMHQQGWNF